MHAPYGYRYLRRHGEAAGQLLVDDAEAETVRMLYGWLAEERLTLRQILKRLNFGPWLPRCGRRPWSPSTVHHILSDPVYTGTAYANRYEYVAAAKPRGGRKPGYDGKGCRRLRPREQWTPIAVPPLVGQQTWDHAQAQLARNAALSFRNNKKHDYLLRCLLTCGGCGLAMFGTTRPATGGAGRRYYRCAGKDCIATARARPCPRVRCRAVRTRRLTAVQDGRERRHRPPGVSIVSGPVRVKVKVSRTGTGKSWHPPVSV